MAGDLIFSFVYCACIPGVLDVFGYPNLHAALLKNPDMTISVLTHILQNETESQPTVDTDAPESVLRDVILVVTVAGVVILLIIFALLCLCICCYKRKKQ